MPAGEAVARCERCGASWRSIDGVWSQAEPFIPPGFSEMSRSHLAQLERSHFWFVSRDRLLRRCLARFAPGQAGPVLDLGCGSGRFLTSLKETCPARVGVDGHRLSVEQAAKRDPAATWVHADLLHVPFADGQFAIAMALDVLEHLEPMPFLQEAHRLVRPGGMLLIAVPAFPFLWSGVDQAAGHRCRYRVASLRRELERAGWHWEGHTHYQFLLFPLLLLTRLGNRRPLTALERQTPMWLNRLLGRVNQWEVSGLGALSLPWGSSLMAWARRH
ncbi:MAG: class I SAM-dependent methyltransferase [Magnetococcales bacterium]|nr:class I SAM-dependent methyltransferase [Magnetococcales bacterium]